MSPIDYFTPLAGMPVWSLRMMTSSRRHYFGPLELHGDFNYWSYFFCVRTDVPKFTAYVEASYVAFSWILRNSPYTINHCSDCRVKMTKSLWTYWSEIFGPFDHFIKKWINFNMNDTIFVSHSMIMHRDQTGIMPDRAWNAKIIRIPFR